MCERCESFEEDVIVPLRIREAVRARRRAGVSILSVEPSDILSEINREAAARGAADQGRFRPATLGCG